MLIIEANIEYNAIATIVFIVAAVTAALFYVLKYSTTLSANFCRVGFCYDNG